MQLTATQIATIVKNTRENIAKSSNVTSISTRQKRSIIDPGNVTSACISKVAFAVEQELAKEARILLLDAIQSLGRGNEVFSHPDLQNVLEGEWMGHLPHPLKEETQVSEQQKYEQIVERTSDTTIFYVYGGMFMTNTPATVRPIVSTLCKSSGAKAFTVRYRLAPQNPFPAALLDILVGYLSLLYPPPNSLHSPIPASRIVFAGDSAGACLVLALIQVLLYASRGAKKLSYQGKIVPYSLPSGITMISPYADLAHALPSWTSNADHDLMQDITPYVGKEFPSDAIWPTTPPRAHIYVDASLLVHPLVSPSTAKNWTGAPPMWMAVGDERLADSAKVIAKTAKSQGVVVHYENYQSMPHFWIAIFKKWWQSGRCMNSWGKACKAFGEADFGESEVIIVNVNGDIGRESVDELTMLDPSEAEKLIREKMKEMVPWVGTRKIGNSNL